MTISVSSTLSAHLSCCQGTNFILRLAWLATLIQAPVSLGINQNAFDVVMVSLKILRRGVWN